MNYFAVLSPSSSKNPRFNLHQYIKIISPIHSKSKGSIEIPTEMHKAALLKNCTRAGSKRKDLPEIHTRLLSSSELRVPQLRRVKCSSSAIAQRADRIRSLISRSCSVRFFENSRYIIITQAADFHRKTISRSREHVRFCIPARSRFLPCAVRFLEPIESIPGISSLSCARI